MPAQNLPGLMLNRAHPLARGLVRWWPMNEGAGYRIYDVATRTYATFPTSGATWSGGAAGSSILLDGANYLTVVNPTAADLPSGAGARSMSILVRPSSISAGYHWGAAMGSAAPSLTTMIGRNGSTLYGAFYANDLSVANFFAAGKWASIVLTYDGVTAFLYGNGSLLTSGAKTLSLTLNLFYIGNMVSGSELWDGNVSHLRIYNRALSAVEVAQLYADPLAGARAPVSAARYFVPATISPPAAPPTADRLWNRGYVGRIFRRGEKG